VITDSIDSQTAQLIAPMLSAQSLCR